MEHLRILSGAEQTAEYLKIMIGRGRWTGSLPGSIKLAAELGVNAKTVDAALRILEQQGEVISQGRRMKRKIVDNKRKEGAPLRIAILEFDRPTERETYLYQIQHLLLESGYTAFFAEKSLEELHLNKSQVIKMVNKVKADAWIVASGSRDILEWFAEQEIPTFALFGRRNGLPIAGIGPDQPTLTREVVRRLIELGHNRIILITNSSRILPIPGSTERAFLDELTKHGIVTSQYNLPLWEDSIEGLQKFLENMMRYTPPTAVLVNEPFLFLAVQHHLMRMGVKIPDELSMFCSDYDPTFAWLRPTVAHGSWNSQPWVRRIKKWVNNISYGKNDQRQSYTKVDFIEGGTIGPAPK